MLFSSFRISAADVDEVGCTSDVSINTDETTGDTDVEPFEETVEFSIPKDEESFLNPEMGLEYSESYRAQTGEVFGGGASNIMPMMLPFTDSIRAGIKSFQQYINANLPISYYVDIEDQVMADGTQIHQWELHGGNTQQWRFRLDYNNGYYTIQSERNSSFYLGVQNDSTANDVSVVLRSGAITNGMKWDITVSSRGNYVITPRTGTVNRNNRVLAVGMYLANINGIDIEQRDYVNDDNYKYEKAFAIMSLFITYFQPYRMYA